MSGLRLAHSPRRAAWREFLLQFVASIFVWSVAAAGIVALIIRLGA